MTAVHSTINTRHIPQVDGEECIVDRILGRDVLDWQRCMEEIWADTVPQTTLPTLSGIAHPSHTRILETDKNRKYERKVLN